MSFDAGQTLVELDTAMLAARLRERGVVVEPALLESAGPVAYATYDRLSVRDGHPWLAFMGTLLTCAGVSRSDAAALAAWLFEEQPKRNLWRRTVPGMVELCRELRELGVPIGIISNSEGRLAELLREIGIGDLFAVVADSGRLGFEKPDRRIFDWFAAEMNVPLQEIVHIGDSPTADVDGSLAVGMYALGFDIGARGPAPAMRAPVATSATVLRAELVRLDLVGLSDVA